MSKSDTVKIPREVYEMLLKRIEELEARENTRRTYPTWEYVPPTYYPDYPKYVGPNYHPYITYSSSISNNEQ